MDTASSAAHLLVRAHPFLQPLRLNEPCCCLVRCIATASSSSSSIVIVRVTRQLRVAGAGSSREMLLAQQDVAV